MGTNDNSIVTVTVDDVELEGELIVPEGALGIVVFAHGSGSSRHSPRNNFVAEQVRARGVGTLLFDLLTEAEDRPYETRFDIDLLTDRLVGATRWLRNRDDVGDLPVGYFGSSTGSAAALRAAAQSDLADDIAAVVSRGGASTWLRTPSSPCRPRRSFSSAATTTLFSSGTARPTTGSRERNP